MPARLSEPFRPIRYLHLDRDTPQVLCDGVALQQAGGVLGLEEYSIGTMSAWGRDPSHLRPGSFIVGRRDFLLSRAVGKGSLRDGQQFLAGPNRDPEMNFRIDGHNTGFVSELRGPAAAGMARVAQLCRRRPPLEARPGRDRRLGQDRKAAPGGRLAAGRRRQGFGLLGAAIRPAGLGAGPARRRRAEAAARPGSTASRLPVYGWLQRQFQTGDPALPGRL